MGSLFFYVKNYIVYILLKIKFSKNKDIPSIIVKFIILIRIIYSKDIFLQNILYKIAKKGK